MSKATFLVGFTVISLFYIIAPVQAFESSPIGWASVSDVCGTPYTITGGSAGSTVTVTNATSFNTYATSSTHYVILVAGPIDISGFSGHKVKVQSNKTIIGIGSDPCIYGNLDIDGTNNIIIRNLNISYDVNQGCDSPSNDGITIENAATHIWVDHCSIYNTPDGLCDPTKHSDYITISWCKFFYTADANNTCHHNCCLVGSGDGDTGDMGKLHETFHHNWWGARCVERMPSVRYGRVHAFNNYYNCAGNNYCVRTRLYAECLVENNYFENVQNPWERLVTTGTAGLLHASGNTLVNVTWDANYYPGVVLIDGNDTVTMPPYSYTLDANTNVNTIVPNGSGVNKLTPSPNPMTFSVAPYGPNSHSIAMTATTATCADGVQYFFHCTAPGDHNSGWQDSPSYTDTNLVPDTNYTYTVQARNKTQTLFTGAASSPASATTPLWTCTSSIDSDLDYNCQVDFFDYAILANEWAGNWSEMLDFAEDWLTCNRDPSSECGSR